MEKHQNFIDGNWCAPISKEWLENINPAEGTNLGLFPRSGKDDIKKAATAAAEALRN